MNPDPTLPAPDAGDPEHPPNLPTLAELGFDLPVGVEHASGARTRGFGFKSWRSSDERAIGALRDKNRAMSQGAFASQVLAHFLTQWGHHDFAEMLPKARLLVLNQSYAADIYTAWMQLRREVLGNSLDVPVVCGACKASFPYTVDLGTVEVRYVPDEEELARPFVLRDGVEWRGKLHRTLTLKPVRWDVYEQIGKGSAGINLGDMKLALLASAIVGLGGEEQAVSLPASALDLTKFDLESLVAHVDSTQPGPDLELADKCPACGAAFTRSMPWVYDSFFSVRSSSRGAPPPG